MAAARIHCRVYGLVQGVAFRAATQAEARRLGLCGWVRNRSDGTVELVAEGEAAGLQLLLTWGSRGPPAARVTRLETNWETCAGHLYGFVIRASA